MAQMKEDPMGWAILEDLAKASAQLGVTIARCWARDGIMSEEAALAEQAGHLGMTPEEMLEAAK